MSSEPLEKRARRSRSRWAICRREYRERLLAAGVWFRLRRLLVFAESAFGIPAAAAAELEAEGARAATVGAELEPPLQLVFVPRGRAEAIADRQPLEVRLSLELLTARFVVLVPFDDLGPPDGSS